MEAARAITQVGELRLLRRRTFVPAEVALAAVALVNELPLYTRDPDDFTGLDDVLTVVGVQTSWRSAPPPHRAGWRSGSRPPGG